jgi:hypothetical protein
VSREPLSFWAATTTTPVRLSTGIRWRENAAGKALILPYARFEHDDRRPTEALWPGRRMQNLTTVAETFFALAAIVAGEMYPRSIPVVILDEHDAASLQSACTCESMRRQ